MHEEKQQLENLISQHERANIKMYIQINEGESEEIEKYKIQLASLFEKYKQLEKLVRKQTDKSKVLSQRLADQDKEIKSRKPELADKVLRLETIITEMQAVISDQNDALSMALN